MSRFFGSIILALLLVLGSGQSNAQQEEPQEGLREEQKKEQPGQGCTTRRELVELLANEFGEHSHGYGVIENGSLMELFLSAGGATWTMVITRPSMVSCLIASGFYWQTVPLKKKTGGRHGA